MFRVQFVFHYVEIYSPYIYGHVSIKTCLVCKKLKLVLNINFDFKCVPRSFCVLMVADYKIIFLQQNKRNVHAYNLE